MLILPYHGPDFGCPKCGNMVDQVLCFNEADEEAVDAPKLEHLDLVCDRCGFRWISMARGLQIENEWDDRDAFTDSCPKCGHDNLKMKFKDADEPHLCDLDISEEHLHVNCRRCSFVWLSLPMDGKAEGAPAERVVDGAESPGA